MVPIDAGLNAALQATPLLPEDNDDDDLGLWRGALRALAPIVRGAMLLRNNVIKPVILIIPEWLVLVYLIGRNVAVAVAAVRIKRAAGRGASNDDLMFAGMYMSAAILFAVISSVLFVLLADRKVSQAIIVSLLSCIGVWASVALDNVLRHADGDAFRSDEASVEAADRRCLYLHGGTGFALAVVLLAIPATCPWDFGSTD